MNVQHQKNETFDMFVRGKDVKALLQLVSVKNNKLFKDSGKKKHERHV